MSCKKCKCKVCSCIKNDVPKIAVNGVVQNPNENDVVNIKVPTKTSQLINDSGFGQGNGGGTGGQKIENIRVNGELVPIINKEAIMNVPTKISNLINDSNFVTKPYVDTHIVNKANPHEVTKEQVGLGNVDNTSDLNKPISTATQLALDSKIPTTDVKSEIIYEDLKPVNSKAVEKYAVKKVNTIADLRLTKGDEEGQVITLLGYQKAGDKKPLNYIYSVNSLSLDDGGRYINSTVGSWTAILNNTVSTLDYGIFNNASINSNEFKAILKSGVKNIQIDSNVNLGGQEITLSGQTLIFKGGVISNGTLKGIFHIGDNFNVCFASTLEFKDITIGTDYFRPEWFGAKGDFSYVSKVGTDDSDAFTKAVESANTSGVHRVKLSAKVYYIKKGIDVKYGNILFEGVESLMREDRLPFGFNDVNGNLYSCIYTDDTDSVINCKASVSQPLQFRDINFFNDYAKNLNFKTICVNFNAEYDGPTWPVYFEKCHFNGFHKAINIQSTVTYCIHKLYVRSCAFMLCDWAVYFADVANGTSLNLKRNLTWEFDFNNNVAHACANIYRGGNSYGVCKIEQNNLEGSEATFLDGTSTADTYQIDIEASQEASIIIRNNHWEAITHKTLALRVSNSASLNLSDNNYIGADKQFCTATVFRANYTGAGTLTIDNCEFPIYVDTFNDTLNNRIQIVDNAVNTEICLANSKSLVDLYTNSLRGKDSIEEVFSVNYKKETNPIVINEEVFYESGGASVADDHVNPGTNIPAKSIFTLLTEIIPTDNVTEDLAIVHTSIYPNEGNEGEVAKVIALSHPKKGYKYMCCISGQEIEPYNRALSSLFTYKSTVSSKNYNFGIYKYEDKLNVYDLLKQNLNVKSVSSDKRSLIDPKYLQKGFGIYDSTLSKMCYWNDSWKDSQGVGV